VIRALTSGDTEVKSGGRSAFASRPFDSVEGCGAAVFDAENWPPGFVARSTSCAGGLGLTQVGRSTISDVFDELIARLGKVASCGGDAVALRLSCESGISCAVFGGVNAKPVVEFTGGKGWFPETAVDAAFGQRKSAVAFQTRARP
jgi:hypothetical protein